MKEVNYTKFYNIKNNNFYIYIEDFKENERHYAIKKNNKILHYKMIVNDISCSINKVFLLNEYDFKRLYILNDCFATMQIKTSNGKMQWFDGLYYNNI